MLMRLSAQVQAFLVKGRVASACHLGLKDPVAVWEAQALMSEGSDSVNSPPSWAVLGISQVRKVLPRSSSVAGIWEGTGAGGGGQPDLGTTRLGRNWGTTNPAVGGDKSPLGKPPGVGL